MNQALFWIFAVMAVSSALLTVTRRNPVACAIWLVATFFSLAAIYTLLGAFFIGVIQILVYAGAIMILFLFVIMLLNLGHGYHADLRGSGWMGAAGIAAVAMMYLLGRAFLGAPTPAPLGHVAGPTAMANQLAQNGTVGVISLPLYTDYFVPLQATAILLFVAVVGAVVLAKRKV
ncbi:MAG TPA: NADH-quinone oxidoreductase subunit J [Longimicrobiaceae bacterium]|nr:NADH-quinone oxidoreductase subunit J [Longimicrobiaceae bacterium]